MKVDETGPFLYLLSRLSELLCLTVTVCPPSGLLIYGGYGVWHSTLELDAREQQAHASSYQRYDDHLDDTFSPDDSLYPQEQEERPYQGWSAPEERGYDCQQHNQDQQEDRYDDLDGEQHQSRYEDTGDQRGYQSGPGGQNSSRGSGSRGRTNHGFDVGEEED